MDEPVEPTGDDILVQIETAIKAVIMPAHQEDVEAAMLNAEKVLYDPSMTQMLIGDMGKMTLEDPQKVALGCLGLVTLLREDERMRFSDELLVPVAALSGVSILRFMVESEMVELQPEFVGNVFEEMFAVLMQKLNIGREDLEALAGEQMQKATSINPNDPEKLVAQEQGIIGGAAA